MVKLLNDIKNMPALNDLCTYLNAQCMGGPSLGKQTILTKQAKIFHSVLSWGFSIQMACHQYEVYKKQTFCSFDFGSK